MSQTSGIDPVATEDNDSQTVKKDAQELESVVRQAISVVYAVPTNSFALSSDLREALGGNSLMLLEVSECIYENIGSRIPDRRLYALATAQDYIDALTDVRAATTPSFVDEK